MAGNFCLLHFPETGYTERPKMRRDTVLSPMICSLRQRISGRKHSFPASHFSFYMPEYFEFANYTSLTVLIFECILRQHRTMGTAGFGGSFAPIVQYEKWEIHPVFPHFPYFRLCQNLSPNLLAPLCGAALKHFGIKTHVVSLLRRCNTNFLSLPINEKQNQQK